MTEQDYELEHGGIWGTTNVTWTCDDCGVRLHSPSDVDRIDGQDICNECQEDS